MRLILSFFYNGQLYIIFEYQTKIFLGKKTNNNLITMDDSEKKILRKIILLLISNDFSKNKILEKNITINYQKEEINTIENAIILDLSDKKDLFLENCASLNTVKENKKNNFNFKFVSLFIIISFIIIGSVYFLNIKKDVDNSEFLQKYTFVRDNELSEFYKEEIKIVNITQKTSNNLFNDSYIKFENPYDGYTLIRSLSKKNNDAFNMNLYQGSNIPALATWKVEEMYKNSFEFIDLETIQNEYDISLDEVFKRNNIYTSLDLMYNIILNSSKEVTSKSSKDEIIDKFVFEYYRPLIFPYDKDSSINKIIFFTGEKYGYANVTDNMIMINLKFNIDEYRIIYEYSNEEQNKLTEEEIINIVSTLEFNE